MTLHLDSPAVLGYNEIDAVGLRSGNRQTQWAKEATASSTFGIGIPVEPMVVPVTQPKTRVDEVAEDLKRVRQQVEELQKDKDDLKKLLERLKEKLD